MQKKLVYASPLPHPQTQHATRAPCPHLASPQSGQDWKGLKAAAKPREADLGPTAPPWPRPFRPQRNRTEQNGALRLPCAQGSGAVACGPTRVPGVIQSDQLEEFLPTASK